MKTRHRSHLLPALALVLALNAPAISAAAPPDDLNLIKKQYQDFLQEVKLGGGKDEVITGFVKSLKPDGTWPDVHYEMTPTSNSIWKAMSHLDRLESMSLAYTNPTGKLHGDPALKAAIHSALDFWIAKDMRNPNWWYNEIGVPMNLSYTLLLLGPEVTPQELAPALKICARADENAAKMTGQNLVWVSGIMLTCGLVENNFDLVKAKRDIIAGQIVVTPEEGIQVDFSFHQHGAQQQFGNYGLAFASDTVQWMLILRGTSLAFDTDPEKLQVLRNYLLKGEDEVVWKGSMDISSCGRQLTPHSLSGKGTSLFHIFQHLLLADASNAAAYQASLDRNGPDAAAKDDTLVNNRYFWRSDYMVHRRARFYVSTKMSSCRVKGTEVVNSENLQGLHLGDGATYVYITNQEYPDIFPVWDWSRLPGTTALVTTDKTQLRPTNNVGPAAENYAGGVSDGNYGAAALGIVTPQLSGHKSWFYFDDQIVCLGAGLQSTQPAPPTPPPDMVTSVSQCLARGDVTVTAASGTSTASAGIQEYPGLKTAYHDGIGYLFLEPGKVMLGTQPQTGSWNDVAKAGKSDPVTQNVFSIWIDHGAQPQGAHYAYTLFPAISPDDWKTRAAQPGVTVLSNTADLQAVRNAALGLTGAAFFQAGTLTVPGGKTIMVDQPCLVFFNEHAQTLSVSDPAQTLKELNVTIGGVAAKIALPDGVQAGSTVTQPWR